MIKKIFFVCFFILTSWALVAQNPSWLVGSWSGGISLLDTDPQHWVLLSVPTKSNKLRLRIVGDGINEKWNLKSVDENSATYSRNLSKRDTLLPELIISLLDNSYVNIDLFYPRNDHNMRIGYGKLKKD